MGDFIRWKRTGAEPFERWIATYDDESYLAVLTWQEGGEGSWRYQNDDGSSCITRVWETGENYYEWKTPVCQFEGYDEDGETYIEIDGREFHVPQIQLNEKPKLR